jgi:hypothetical protein
MPLLSLWKSDPASVNQFTIEQVVATAGNGDLKDDSICAEELRSFLSQVPTQKLAQYTDHCLNSGFTKSGMVLQDLVNELGRRLDFKAENGRYQGKPNAIGNDGIWFAPEGRALVIEVKTTDAYRLSLDTIAGYRDKLRAVGKIADPSSVLIVVGRNDTGELEAQVRGSRHAWDIRLISADALLKLVKLKENSDDPETGRKIRSLLTPMEYTRLDQMIDVMFTAATDVEATLIQDLSIAGSQPTPVEEITPADSSEPGEATSKGTWVFTDSALLQAKRLSVLVALSKKWGTPLITKSRALSWSGGDHETRVVCSISKRYTKGTYPYWYAYHPGWDDFLKEAKNGFFVLGCMDQPFAYAIPWATINSLLPGLNTTTTERGSYWHVHLAEGASGHFAILVPKEDRSLDLQSFQVALSSAE